MDTTRLGPKGKRLASLYEAMAAALGPSHWWPAQSPFEVAVGAVLTQNTAWSNVEKAIANLRAAGALSPSGMRGFGREALIQAVRPSGCYQQKTQKLLHFLSFLDEYGCFDGSSEEQQALACLHGLSDEDLRPALLSVRGIGPETADCIMLYALNRPSFVVDAYTKRILHRHGLVWEDAGYDELRELFMDSLPHDTELFGEYHALLVRTAKDFCRKPAPRCALCPLEPFLEHEPV